MGIISKKGDRSMYANQYIKCDVEKCKHNAGGINCRLESIKVTCANQNCTCCGDYAEKE